MSFDLEKHLFEPGEGEYLHWGGPAAGRVTIMVDPTISGPTGLCVLTQSLDPGSVVPVHHHERAEQVLFIISGRGQVSLADHQVEAGPGFTVHVPKGVAHSIANTGDEPLSILEITSPPGFQEIFRKMHALSEPDAEDIARIGAEHDITVHPGGGS
jgi:mannose-6-phosphate isomerase-like protein (cupin superfamily)